MGSILRNLLWTAMVSRGAGEMRRALRRARQRAALILLGLVLALVGLGFLLAAGFMALADLIGAVRASLVVGAALALVAGGFLLYAGRRRRGASSVSSDPGSGQSAPIAMALFDIGRDLGAAAARNPGTFVTAAFVIGLVLGRTRR